MSRRPSFLLRAQMGRRNFVAICAALMVVAGVALPSVPLRAETLILGADPYCPYNCEEGAKLKGFMVDIAKEALGATGHKVTYAVMPWTRALKEARAGKIAGVIGVGTGESEGLVLHAEEPAAMTRQMVLTPSGTAFTWNGVESLRGRRLGVIAEYSYGDAIDAYVAAEKGNRAALEIVHGNDALTTILRLLTAGRIDAAVSDGAVAIFEARHLELDTRILLTPTGRTSPLFVGFSKKRRDAETIARQMRDGIRALRQSGRLNTILATYGLSDWAGS